ncbi:hypothetical protein [Streptomyces griseosporeus]|uniref:hypothetical protein n=1 Tax=Streptomyces griseosporeus TaxID=1910 RepID=UPI0036F62FEA
MNIMHTQPSRLFIATGGGAGLNPDFPCGHGTAALSLHLLSQHGEVSEDIGIILPRCAAAGLIGGALAYIAAAEGAAAADAFLADVDAAYEKATREVKAYMADQEAAQAACCEAGYRSQGREHTCQPGPDTTA